MKIQLCIDTVIVAESEIDTSPGSVFQALEVVERLGVRWDFRLDPADVALEQPQPYYFESTLIQVRLIP